MTMFISSCINFKLLLSACFCYNYMMYCRMLLPDSSTSYNYNLYSQYVPTFHYIYTGLDKSNESVHSASWYGDLFDLSC